MNTSTNLWPGCHKGLADSFTHSQHDNALICVDCHMSPNNNEDGQHNLQGHSFYVRLETCNQCHSNELHNSLSIYSDIVPSSLSRAHKGFPVQMCL
jgi:hypothetical protein